MRVKILGSTTLAVVSLLAAAAAMTSPSAVLADAPSAGFAAAAVVSPDPTGAPGPVLSASAAGATAPGSTAMIVRFAEGIDPVNEAGRLGVPATSLGAIYETPFVGAAVEASPAEVRAFKNDPNVVSVEADQRVTIADASSRQGVEDSATWDLDRIDQRLLPLSGTYDSAGTGAGVEVYTLDTGIRADHVEFGGRVHEGAWLDDGLGPDDCNGHGTHVAGTIGSATYGVAKDVSLIPVRVLDCAGAGSASGIISGLDWIVANHQPGVPAVLNMSIGGPASSTLDLAVQAAIDDGVVVVDAAGNDGQDACLESPARLPAAITVAATDSTDFSPSWSDFGSCVDLFAPGVDVLSTWNTTATALNVLSGTSMASPHVAGVAALILADQPTLSPAGVAAQLIANTTPGVVDDAGRGSPNLLLYSPPPPTAPINATTQPAVVPPVPAYSPVVPARFVDSRGGGSTIDGLLSGVGLRGAGVVTEVQVAGRGGVPVDASAVVLNVTATEAQGPGFVSVFPCGTDRPNGSSLNYVEGGTVANAVIAKVGVGGRVCVFTYAATHLIVDLNGYYRPS